MEVSVFLQSILVQWVNINFGVREDMYGKLRQTVLKTEDIGARYVQTDHMKNVLESAFKNYFKGNFQEHGLFG